MADNRNIIVTMQLRDQLTGKMKRVEGSIGSVQRQLNQMQGSTQKASAGFGTLTANVLKAAPAFAVATAAITAVYQALRLVRDEFVGGLKAVEDYNLAVATMAGFMTTFSQRAKEGDLTGAFEQSVLYSKELIEVLEVLDAKTVATGQDLTLMAQQFIKAGVQIDLSLQGTEEGIVNIANALVLLTTGQNKTKQIAQEIRGLMSGQSKESNTLLKLLEAQNPLIKEQLKLWQQQGTVIPNLGKELEGFGKSVSLIEKTWEAVGSTMETIHNKILRDAFRPIYEELLQLATDFNSKLFENGELTKLSRDTAEEVRVKWVEIKTVIGGLVDTLSPIIEAFKLFGGAAKTAFEGWAALFAALDPVLERFKNFFSVISDSFVLLGEQIKYSITSAIMPWKEDQGEEARLYNEWQRIGKRLGSVFAGGLKEEIDDSIVSFYQQIEAARQGAMGTEKVGAPVLTPPVDQDAIDETEKATEKIAKAVEKLREKLEKEGQAITKAVRMPWEIYTDKIKELDTLLRGNFITQETYARAVKAAGDALMDAHEKAGKLNEKIKESEDVIKTFSETVEGRLENAFADTYRNILGGTLDFKDAMISAINDILTEFMRLMFFKPAAQALAGGLQGFMAGPWNISGGGAGILPSDTGAFFSGNLAKGGILQNISGKLNQIVDKPTIFPFARGIGLMGEAGPEAVMPLTRTSGGALGVKAEGSGGGMNIENVNITIQALDSKSINEMMQRNPGAVVAPFLSELQGGNIALRSGIRRTL